MKCLLVGESVPVQNAHGLVARRDVGHRKRPGRVGHVKAVGPPHEDLHPFEREAVTGGAHVTHESGGIRRWGTTGGILLRPAHYRSHEEQHECEWRARMALSALERQEIARVAAHARSEGVSRRARFGSRSALWHGTRVTALA